MFTRVVGTAARAALVGMGNVRHGWVSQICLYYRILLSVYDCKEST